MKNPLTSTKFIAAALSTLVMGILVGVCGVSVNDALIIVSPLAAYVPVQGLVDLRKPHIEGKRKGD